LYNLLSKNGYKNNTAVETVPGKWYNEFAFSWTISMEQVAGAGLIIAPTCMSPPVGGALGGDYIIQIAVFVKTA
jgi:hypothetical protein